MKKLLVILTGMLFSVSLQAQQYSFPKSAKEDKEKIMSEAYWKIWNPQVQKQIDQVKDLMARGCKVDIMGSQMHLFKPQQCLDIAAGKEIQTPDHIWGWNKRLSQVGLPIHLSEITITAPGNDTYGRKVQAIITQNLYRLWFSLELMMGITWWNVVDGCGVRGEPTVSGLFTREMAAKPAFYALDNLINNEWKTTITAKPDKNGQVRFRGFKGNYRISWKDQSGNMQTKEYYLK